MGGGGWTTESFASYSCMRGRSYDYKTKSIAGGLSAQEMFTERTLAKELNPYKVVRECCDSEEHPCTIPIILALDVTGSMGKSSVEVAKKLNVVMTDLYEKIKDVEFMTMAIGDLSYDSYPIQASQFESDIRIAEQLDKIYFEGGGGGNSYESYTAAWYFASRHTKLDCWNRGKKGLIITIGDEFINPYLPKDSLERVTGDNLQADIDTKALFEEVSEKYDLYHLNIRDTYSGSNTKNIETFAKIIGEDHVRNVTVNDIAGNIVDIVIKHANDTLNDNNSSSVTNTGGISW